jgi:hypothetical protein
MSDRKSRMTLTAWAHVAEIVAAVGVITGLVFLTLQVKENTDITRASAYDRGIDRLNAWRANVVRDPEISRLYLAYSDATTEELTPEDQFRLQVLLTSLWGVYETAFYSHDYGLLGRSEWSRFRVQICNHRGLNLTEWNHIVAPRISSRFLTYIEDSCG